MKKCIVVILLLWLTACTTGHVGVSGGSNGVSSIRVGTGVGVRL
ncbi:hypothetical protein [Edaphovirga cremea]|nr:hypothetical protein [Edaphovirga cremea]